MLFTCLIHMLRGHFNLLYCDLFPPASTHKSDEPVLRTHHPLLLFLVGQHRVSSLPCPEKILLIYASSPSLSLVRILPSRWKAGSLSLALLCDSEPTVVRSARPHVFAASKFRLRLEPLALLMESSFSTAWPKILAFACLPVLWLRWLLNWPRS